MELDIPEPTEQTPCPLCGGSDGIVVGNRGRFGMAVKNVCCAGCATVYVSPRPSRDAMSQYYRSTYRKHYGAVGYVDGSGTTVVPGQSGYEQTLHAWHSQQADNALSLTAPPRGASVLEIGCRHGKTLSLMRERGGIEPFGIEPGEDEAEQARRDGIDCFTGALETFDPGTRRFDQIQCFHVLEHVHDPLGALLTMRAWLKPAGKLLIEVPNVYQPYGLLEENFFQNVHLVSYGPSTLPALVRRAGFVVSRVVDASTLFVVAEASPLPDDSLPLPFSPDLLVERAHDATWLATRLQSYASLARAALALEQRGCSSELTSSLIRTLAMPAFIGVLVETCATFVERLVARGMLEQAIAITLAVASGPHPDELRHEFRGFAERLGAAPEALAACG